MQLTHRALPSDGEYVTSFQLCREILDHRNLKRKAFEEELLHVVRRTALLTSKK